MPVAIAGMMAGVAPYGSSPLISPAARKAGISALEGRFWRVGANTLQRSVPSPAGVPW